MLKTETRERVWAVFVLFSILSPQNKQKSENKWFINSTCNIEHLQKKVLTFPLASFSNYNLALHAWRCCHSTLSSASGSNYGVGWEFGLCEWCVGRFGFPAIVNLVIEHLIGVFGFTKLWYDNAGESTMEVINGLCSFRKCFLFLLLIHIVFLCSLVSKNCTINSENQKKKKKHFYCSYTNLWKWETKWKQQSTRWGCLHGSYNTIGLG